MKDLAWTLELGAVGIHLLRILGLAASSKPIIGSANFRLLSTYGTAEMWVESYVQFPWFITTTYTIW